MKIRGAMKMAQTRCANAGKHNYLSFRLGDEEYGIDILKVQEIRGYDAVTRIADTPEFIKGVINLRGAIVPIVDLRLRFQLGEAKYDDSTVVVILSIAGRTIGVVVESVSDVLEIPADRIRLAPNIDSQLDAGFITGLATPDPADPARMLILIEIEELMLSPNMGIVQKNVALAVA
jgi:purine-binding chemotaxis protein CheW